VTDEAGRTRLHWPALAERLRQALASIHDPLTLAQFGLDINPTAGADEVQRMKTAYLGSDAFRKQLNGGVPEMYLLSHCYQGALAFRTFTSTPGPRGHDKWHFYCAASPAVQAANEDSRARDVHELREGASACKPKYEIVLHACAYQGGRTANHYEQVTFTMKDKTVLTKWRCSLSAASSDAERRRLRCIHVSCMKSRDATIATSKIIEEERLAMTRQMAGSGNNGRQRRGSGSNRTPASTSARVAAPSTPRRGCAPVAACRRLSFGPSPRLDRAGKPRSATIVSPARHAAAGSAEAASPQPHCDWRQRRVRAVREIAPECAGLFVQSAGQLMAAYKRCSEADNRQGADAVLHMILNYPDQTLRPGSTAQQKQWLNEAAAQAAVALPSIVPEP